MLRGFGELLAEGDGAAPEFRRALGIDENAMEELAGERGPDGKQANWHENGQRAFVRVIAAAAGGDVMRIMRAVAMLLVRTVVIAVKRVLDMLRCGPARRPEEGQE